MKISGLYKLKDKLVNTLSRLFLHWNQLNNLDIHPMISDTRRLFAWHIYNIENKEKSIRNAHSISTCLGHDLRERACTGVENKQAWWPAFFLTSYSPPNSNLMDRRTLAIPSG